MPMLLFQWQVGGILRSSLYISRPTVLAVRHDSHRPNYRANWVESTYIVVSQPISELSRKRPLRALANGRSGYLTISMGGVVVRACRCLGQSDGSYIRLVL